MGVKIKNHVLSIRRTTQSEVASLFHKLKSLSDMKSGDNFSKVICIKQMFKIHELEESNSYNRVYDRIKVECSKFGKINKILIPRPSEYTSSVPGLGKAFIEYTTKEGAKFAKENLEQLKFFDKQVSVTFHPEEKFLKGIYD